MQLWISHSQNGTMQYINMRDMESAVFLLSMRVMRCYFVEDPTERAALSASTLSDENLQTGHHTVANPSGRAV
jgi:hypothetical protein